MLAFIPLMVGLGVPAFEAKSLNVLTFNIRYANPDDGDNRWELRKDLAVSTIRSAKPDLIGLQEALRGQLDDLHAALPEFSEIGVGREDGISAGEYAAVLYRTKRFKILAQGQFWFSETPDVPGSKAWGANVTRICTWARLDDTAAKRKFFVYDLHLDHEAKLARENSIQMLVSRVLRREDPDPTVILGDFNTGEESVPIQNMLGHHRRQDGEPEDTLWWPYWIDAYRQINAKADGEGTFHNFTGTPGKDRIDYVFVSPDWTVTAAAILRDHDGARYPSDHFPVSATIQLGD